jgi:hypothetical protein
LDQPQDGRCLRSQLHQRPAHLEGAELKPHLVKTFKLSNDKQFAEKVRDIIGLYLDPPDKAVVFSVDEKSQIQEA